MNNFESGRSSWRDQELDALLYDFFRNELPEELRGLPSHPETPPMTSTPRRREQTALALVIGLTAVAASLLLAVSALWSPPVNRTGASPHRFVRTVVPAGGSLAERSEIEDPSNAGSPAPMEQLVIERYDTATGPVEQRTNVRWTNVSVFEPESGTEVDVMIPEVNIEVYEIEDE